MAYQLATNLNKADIGGLDSFGKMQSWLRGMTDQLEGNFKRLAAQNVFPATRFTGDLTLDTDIAVAGNAAITGSLEVGKAIVAKGAGAPPAGGSVCEMLVAGGAGYLQAYNYTSPAYLALIQQGLNITLQAGTTTRMYIDSTGSILYDGTIIHDTTAQAAGTGGTLTLGGKYTDAGDYTTFGTIGAYKDNAVSGQYGGNIEMFVRQNGGGLLSIAQMTSEPAIWLKGRMTMDGSNKMKEQASATASTAGYGQLYVKNTAPCELWFVDDAGAETQLA